jgi:hypothetical protein
MPFGLKNAPSEFQKWMDDIFRTGRFRTEPVKSDLMSRIGPVGAQNQFDRSVLPVPVRFL